MEQRAHAGRWQEVAEEQAGVLTRRQALTSGLSEDQWQWRLDAGRWQPLVAGIAVPHSGPVSGVQQAWAAVLACGPGACLSGDAALTTAGMPVGELSSLDVAVPEERVVVARRLPTGLRVIPRRVKGLGELRHPVLLPPTVRLLVAVLHAAAWAPSDRAAEWRVAAAVQQRRVTPDALRLMLDGLPRLRRRALLCQVLDDVELGAHAASELDFLRFLRRWHLPRPDRLQRPVRLGLVRYLDAWWERPRVAVELDGPHHRTVGA